MYLVTSPIDNVNQVQRTLWRLGWKLEDNKLVELCQLLSRPQVRWSLHFHLRNGTASIELLQRIKLALDDPEGQMLSHSHQLAEARLQVLRLYRAIDQHNWSFMPWVLEYNNSWPRRLQVFGLCLTPSSSFG